MVPNRQKVRLDGRNGWMDDAKIRRRIMKAWMGHGIYGGIE